MFDKKGPKQPQQREAEPLVSRPAPTQGATPSQAPAASSSSSRVAMVGEGISITGDVAADSNLKIEGRIEGRAVTSTQDVEVSESGIIQASITAKVVRIAGAVAGDINGSEKVVISKSGRVQGNIVAPRVQLDDGALFRGSIDMTPAQKEQPAKAAESKPAAQGKPAAQTKPASPAPTGKPAGSEAKKEPSLTLKGG